MRVEKRFICASVLAYLEIRATFDEHLCKRFHVRRDEWYDVVRICRQTEGRQIVEREELSNMLKLIARIRDRDRLLQGCVLACDTCPHHPSQNQALHRPGR
jgi:hypothetical protein